ncbi:MAG: DHH family phosphoesterase [Acidobacteriota bacterium]
MPDRSFSASLDLAPLERPNAEQRPRIVIGHVRPDTDAIAAALGYAWVLRERDGVEAIAARAGAIEPQTAWALEQAGVDAPELLADASPRLERVARHLPPTAPDAPLLDAWKIAAEHRQGAPVLDDDGRPLGLVTGDGVFTLLTRRLRTVGDLRAMSAAELLDLNCADAIDDDAPRFERSERLTDLRQRLRALDRQDVLVVDDAGRYVGVARVGEALAPPRLHLVLVDHNEPEQAVPGIEAARIVEVLDHHRIGSLGSREPIPFVVEPVGSTSTLVAERAEAAGLVPPASIALMLLSGLFSDTLALRSPTAGPRDRRIAAVLETWAAERLAGRAREQFVEALLDAGAGRSLARRSVEEVLDADRKRYPEGPMSLAQVELTSFGDLDDAAIRARLQDGLEARAAAEDVRLVALMATDVVTGNSRLLAAGEPALLEALPFGRRPDGTWSARGVVSRKKQLLPRLLELFDGG